MYSLFLHIYDYFQGKHKVCMVALVVIVGMLLAMVFSLSYNENIFSFLPMSENSQKAISIYQDISGGQRIVAMFKKKEALEENSNDQASLYQALDTFSQLIVADSTKHRIIDVTSRVDLDFFFNITDFLYANIPVMLTDSDYLRIENLLAQPQYFEEQLKQDYQMLMSSEGIIQESFIRKDPLNFFSPVVDRLQARQAMLPFLFSDDGLIYTQGKKYALAMFNSPYGPLESANNARLVSDLENIAAYINTLYPDIEIGFTGAPIISVGNAQQIKKDSIGAIFIALLLILVLLIYSFRKVKKLLLIGITVLFGWIFAMAIMSVVRNDVSLIVLGIGSIIIGIAVNYPLHFIAHAGNGLHVRNKLKEMISPLLIGNITTVGAFAALVPLDAPALRDLGLFAAFMLIGTILFVLIFLPHMVGKEPFMQEEQLLFGKLAVFNPKFSKWGICILVVLTLFLGYNSFYASFDSDIRHINYLNDEQELLLSELGVAAGLNDTTSIYVVTEGDTWDDALDANLLIGKTLHGLKNEEHIDSYSNIQEFICSESEQKRRIDRWNDFWLEHQSQIKNLLPQYMVKADFNKDAFNDFYTLIEADYTPHSFEYFEPIRSLLFGNNFSTESGKKAVIEVIDSYSNNLSVVSSEIESGLSECGFVFDLRTLNNSVAQSLSNDFNYIGWVCGLIVFVFLWFSFGRVELALLAFLPMALGWIWILGIMNLFNIQFNIVNVILATFIFGQGDDYTIFITEGLISEYALRKKLLPSFKNSILISALIMFIGMGSLIVAQHPALSSLAEVTIVGMSCVVFMSWVVPCISFSWLVTYNDKPRMIPLTLSSIIRTLVCRLFKLFKINITNPYKLPFIYGAHTRYYHHFLIGQYLYKGYRVEAETRSLLKQYDDYGRWIDGYQLADKSTNEVNVLHAGRGQFSLLFAWVHPELNVYSYCTDADDFALLDSCSLKPKNLHVVLCKDQHEITTNTIGNNTIDCSQLYR